MYIYYKLQYEILYNISIWSGERDYLGILCVCGGGAWGPITLNVASSPGPLPFQCSVCNIEKVGGPGDEATLNVYPTTQSQRLGGKHH